MPTRLHLLGRTEVLYSGRIIRLPAERRFQLLVVLAIRRRPVDRDWLAALFWPERDNATARRNLRKLAFDAQVAEWAAGIEGERSTLEWRVATDVEDFDRALDEGRVEDALKCYAGPLCEGFEDPTNDALSEFLRTERARLAERWRAAILTEIAKQAAPRERLALSRRLLTADALDEEAVAIAIQAQIALGHDAEAAREYRAFGERLAETLGIEPSATLRRLMREAEAAPAAAPAAVPAVPAGFVGRTLELNEIAALTARPDCRQLTLTGPGGVGKSRLAKAVLPRLETLFQGGIWWVPLDDLQTATQIVPRLAQLLGVELAEHDDALARVAHRFAGRPALIVLDNAEHIETIAALIERLCALAPDVKILATSRRRLGVTGEWLLPLAGLPVPQDGEDATATDAVRLFELRAREADPAFAVAHHPKDSARLVRALGGLPLAIELAAHWIRALPLSELVAEVQTSLDVLERDEEGAERPEHRSVRATFEQSWRMLAPAEQKVLAALSVFVGTFSRAAARGVAEALLPVLATLVDKSLLQTGADGRFHLHPLLSQFAREKLRAAGDEERFVRAHSDWYLRLLADQREAAQDGRRDALDLVGREFENIRRAWNTAIATHAADSLGAAAAPLMYFLQIRVRATEGAALLQDAAVSLDPERDSDRRAAAEVLRALAQLHYRIGNLEAALGEARRALRLCRLLANREGIRRCLGVLGLTLWQIGDYREAKRCFEDGLRRALADGDAHGVATFTGNVGLIEKALGNYDRALALYREALERNRQVGDLVGVGNQYINLGNLHRMRSEWGLARRCFEEGLAFAERHGHDRALPWFFINLALTSYETGDLQHSEALGQRSLKAARDGGNRQIETQALLHLAQIALQKADTVQARRMVRESLAVACAMRSAPVQLDCITQYGRVLEKEGEISAAASLWTYVAQQTQLDAADRRDLQKLIARIPAGVADEPPELTLVELTQRIIDGAPLRPRFPR